MTHTSVYTISNPGLENGADEFAIVLERAKTGDQSALTELYNLYFGIIYKFVFFRVSHKETAEDLSEEVFIQAFKNIGNLKTSGSFVAWLYQIARNKVIDHYRSQKSLLPLEIVENTLEYETNVIDLLDLEAKQKIFVKLLRELSEEQQLVVKLRFLENLDTVAIASIIRKPEGTVRVIQHRALSRLKELINQFHPGYDI